MAGDYQVVGENKAEKKKCQVLRTDSEALAKQTKERCERAASPEVWTFTQGAYPVAGLPPFDLKWLVGERPKDWSEE